MYHIFPKIKEPDDFIKECYNIHGKESKNASEDGPPFRKLPDVENSFSEHFLAIRFIFWTHKFENISNLQPLLEDCDILAVEDCRDTVFDTKEGIDQEERALENIYRDATTTLANTEVGESEKIQLLQKIGLPEIYKAVLAHSTSSITQIAKLDVGPYEASGLLKLDQSLLKHEKLLGKAIDSSLCSWTQLRDLAYAASSALSEVNQYREAIMVRQIEKLRAENSRKTIAVLVGRSHHKVSQGLKRDGIPIDRYVVKDETAGELPAHVKHWTINKLISADMLQAGLTPTLELDQMVLHEIISYYGEDGMFLCLTRLSNEKNQELVAKLQEIWSAPILKNQLGCEESVHVRREATKQVLRSILSNKMNRL